MTAAARVALAHWSTHGAVSAWGIYGRPVVAVRELAQLLAAQGRGEWYYETGFGIFARAREHARAYHEAVVAPMLQAGAHKDEPLH
jgi:hypothetical protein